MSLLIGSPLPAFPQCHQNPNAIVERTGTIPQLVPLRLSDLHRGRAVTVLDWNDPEIGEASHCGRRHVFCL